MTWALCFNCGQIKFGALCPCPICQVSSCGDVELDILFSDHHLARTTLEELGAVVALLREATDDAELRFAAFLYYVTHNHPELLDVTFTLDGEAKIEALLADLDLPSVTIRRPGGFEPRATSALPGRAPPRPERPGGNGSGKGPP